MANADISYDVTRFMINGEAVSRTVHPHQPSTTTTGEPTKKSLPEQVDDLFLAFLNRHPNDRERNQALRTMAEPEGISHVTWALLNTTEFLFEH